MPDDFDDRPRRPDDDGGFDASRRRRRDRDDAADYDRPPPRKSGSRTLVIVLAVVFGVLFVCGGLGIWGLVTGTSRVREAADRLKSSNNLKQIGLGVQNYEAAVGELPGNTYTAEGKPLLSWRVHILPYVGEPGLYRQFKQDEPWDGPTNKLLLDQMPNVYVVPGTTPSPRLTHYRGFSSPGAVFARQLVPGQVRPAGERLTLTKITDGMSNTILAVEAADPVEWTKPDDLDAAAGKPFPRMGGQERSRKVFAVLFADASVKALSPGVAETALRDAVTYNGNEILPGGWDEK